MLGPYVRRGNPSELSATLQKTGRTLHVDQQGVR